MLFSKYSIFENIDDFINFLNFKHLGSHRNTFGRNSGSCPHEKYLAKHVCNACLKPSPIELNKRVESFVDNKDKDRSNRNQAMSNKYTVFVDFHRNIDNYYTSGNECFIKEEAKSRVKRFICKPQGRKWSCKQEGNKSYEPHNIFDGHLCDNPI